MSDGLFHPETHPERLAERLEEWRPHYRPATPEEHWLFETMVAESLRLDRCRHDEMLLRAELARRARLAWHDDRRLLVEEIGRRLAADPARTVRRLRVSAPGCEWLLDRWRGLDRCLSHQGEWSEAQRELAFNLLGVPHELRVGLPWDPDDPETPDAARLTAREIEGLERAKRAIYHELDDAERAIAELGVEREPSRALMALRRQEAECYRRMLWAETQLEARQGFGQSFNTAEMPPAAAPATLAVKESLPGAAPREQANIVPDEHLCIEGECLDGLASGDHGAQLPSCPLGRPCKKARNVGHDTTPISIAVPDPSHPHSKTAVVLPTMPEENPRSDLPATRGRAVAGGRDTRAGSSSKGTSRAIPG